MEQRVQEWLLVEVDEVIKEKVGKRTLNTVLTILHEMDRKYDERTKLFNILDEDEANALGIVNNEDAENVSENILRLKNDHTMADIDDIEVKLRTDEESWEKRSNVLDCLRYYSKLPNNTVKAKSERVLKEAILLILEHVENKYNVDTTPNMISSSEREAILTISYTELEGKAWGEVVTSLYWKFMQDEIHELINHLRLFPTQFSISEQAYAKLEFFSTNVTFVPEEVSSLSTGLLHAIRYYNAETGSHVVGAKRHSARAGTRSKRDLM